MGNHWASKRNRAESRKVDAAARRNMAGYTAQQLLAVEGLRAYMVVRLDERRQIAQQWINLDSGRAAAVAYGAAFRARHAHYLFYDNTAAAELQFVYQPTVEMVSAFENDPAHDMLDIHDEQLYIAKSALVKRRHAYCCWMLGSFDCFDSSWCLTPADVRRVHVATKRFDRHLSAVKTVLSGATVDVLDVSYIPITPDLDYRLLNQPLTSP